MRIGIFILLSLLLYSCSKTSETEQYAKLVEQWQGKEIIFPDVMTDFLTGDTIDLSDADFTILTYIDSEGCTGCKMKLPLWTEFLYTIDSLSNVNIKSIMVVYPRSEQELKYLLKRDGYENPVFMNSENRINNINDGFSTDAKFQSFLLDSQKRVIAIGNPVMTSSMAEFYKSIILGKRTFNKNGDQSIIAEETKYNFGEVSIGETVSHNFLLINQGYDTVHIHRVLTSCECTEAQLDNSRLIPGIPVSVTIEFKEDSILGEFNRYIQVFYEGIDRPNTFEISGVVVRL